MQNRIAQDMISFVESVETHTVYTMIIASRMGYAQEKATVEE